MLNVFRENLKSLKPVLWLVVASFVITIFAVWGGGAGRQGLGSGNWAAVVGDRSISIRDFQLQARNLENAYRQFLGPEQFQQQREFLGLGQLALEQLIQEELLLQEAWRVGLQVSDREVLENIRRDPSFQENGRFIGKERYLKILQGSGLEPRQYEERIRRSLLIAKMRALIEDGIQVTESEIRREFQRRNESLSAEYLRLAPEDIVDRVDLTEEEIAAFYGERREAYRLPERREGAYTVLTNEELGEEVTVTDEEIYEYYQANLATRFTLSDQRRARHILFRVDADAPPETVSEVEERAAEVLERARAGEDFSELARTHSEDGSAERGGDLGYFSRDQMLPEFSEATFALEVGQVSDLVRTSAGFHIIQLLDEQSQRVQSLEEVRAQIRSLLRFEKIMARGRERLRELRDRMTGPDDFRRVAEEAGLEVRETGPVTADEPVGEAGSGSEVLSRLLFRLAPGEISQPTVLPGGIGLAICLATEAGEIPPLSEVHEEVEADARREKAFSWLQERVREWQDLMGSEPGGLAAAAGELGLEPQEVEDLRRGASLPEAAGSAAVLERAFDLPVGGWQGPERLENGNLLILQVTARKGQPEELGPQRETIRRDLLMGKRQLHLRAVLDRLRSDHSVRINRALQTSLASPS